MKPPSPSMRHLLPSPRYSLRAILPISHPRHASTTTTPPTTPDVAHPSQRPLSYYEPTAARAAQYTLIDSILQSSRPNPHSPSSPPSNKLRTSLESDAQKQFNNDLERQAPRRWKLGDVYAPHDLSSVEMRKFKGRGGVRGGFGTGLGGGEKGRGRRWGDVLDVLAVEPVGEYKNFSMIQEFSTKMGRIKHSRETGLRNVNQRKMARAIRRAIGMGLMPSVHKHPEVLEKEAQAKANSASQGGYGNGRRG